MKGYDDAMEDKKMFHSMLKKAMPGKKIAKHLKGDIKEQKHGIKKDKVLIKSLKSGCK
jgi:hypothetical protein